MNYPLCSCEACNEKWPTNEARCDGCGLMTFKDQLVSFRPDHDGSAFSLCRTCRQAVHKYESDVVDWDLREGDV